MPQTASPKLSCICLFVFGMISYRCATCFSLSDFPYVDSFCQENAVTSKMLLGSLVFTIQSLLVEAMEGHMFNSVTLMISKASANDKL